LTKTIRNNKPQINISISQEHKRNLEGIEEIFKDFDVHAKADYMRFSADELPMQIFIFLSGAFVGGAAWDLLKFAIKKLYKKFPKSIITLRENDNVMYTVKANLQINVIVIPDRLKEFKHIKTFDDLINHFESKKNEK
jgi:hypothetical protein